MRTALALVLFGHGIAHGVGFAVDWQLMTSADVPYRTTIVDGRINLGDAGIRVVGALWLGALVMFVAAAGATFIGHSQAADWRNAALGLSLILCLLGWPEARLGLVVDVILIAALAAASRYGWW